MLTEFITSSDVILSKFQKKEPWWKFKGQYVTKINFPAIQKNYQTRPPKFYNPQNSKKGTQYVIGIKFFYIIKKIPKNRLVKIL